MDSHEAPIVAGITNLAPFLEGLVEPGIQRYGTNLVSGPNTMASGEGGTYRRGLGNGLPAGSRTDGPFHGLLRQGSEPRARSRGR